MSEHKNDEECNARFSAGFSEKETLCIDVNGRGKDA